MPFMSCLRASDKRKDPTRYHSQYSQHQHSYCPPSQHQHSYYPPSQHQHSYYPPSQHQSSYYQPSQYQSSYYRPKPKPRRDMRSANLLPSSAYSSSWYSSNRTPHQPSSSHQKPRQAQAQSRKTAITAFPGSSSEALYDEFRDCFHLPTPARARVSLTHIPRDTLPPHHRTQENALYFEPRGYSGATRPQRREYRDQYDLKDSWHTLRQGPRPRILQVEELGGRFVPENKLGRYL